MVAPASGGAGGGEREAKDAPRSPLSRVGRWCVYLLSKTKGGAGDPVVEWWWWWCTKKGDFERSQEIERVMDE
jgi:hypothetical protein